MKINTAIVKNAIRWLSLPAWNNVCIPRFGYTLVITVLFLISHSAQAQRSIPELWGLHVHDEAHILSKETVDKLESRLIAYQDSTSNEIAILIITSLEGES